MARCLILVFVAVVLWSNGPLDTPVASATTRCGVPAGATVLKRSRGAVVYRLRARGDADPAQVVGCLRSSGRRRHLASETLDFFSDGEVGSVRLAGRWVAFVMSINGFREDVDEVRIVDLRTGRSRVAEFYGASARSLRLSASGRLAWILRRNDDLEGDPAGVYVFTCSARVIDAGDGPFSALRLDGARVRWRDGVIRRSRRVMPAVC